MSIRKLVFVRSVAKPRFTFLRILKSVQMSGSSNRESVHALLRFFLVSMTVLCATSIAIGAMFNDNGHKYVRVTQNHTCVDSYREVLMIDIKNSNVCCDGLRADDWVCVASYDNINKMTTSSPWAFLLPLIPWLSNTLIGILHGLGVVIPLKRLCLYIFIFLYRTYGLYIGMSFIEVSLFGDPTSCWYSKYMKKNSCQRTFDFSDHVVFFVAHFMIPCVIESSVLLHQIKFVKFRRYFPSIFFIICFFFGTCRKRGCFYTLLMLIGIYHILCC